MRPVVYPVLPNAGLGNMLLVWANALVFSHVNDFPMIAPQFNRFHIGPYLRGELDKRHYREISTGGSYLSRWNSYFLVATRKKLFNPPIKKIDKYHHLLYVFNAVPHWSDHFKDLRDFQPLIKAEFLKLISHSLLKAIDNKPTDEIAIHVRLGDFRPLKLNEDFSKVGSVRTPIEWYIRCLEGIRLTVGCSVPATVFSDGYDDELRPLLSLDNVTRSKKNSAISDLLSLSRSKLLITSAGSTFSQWASFLGQQPTVYHPDHFHAGVFPDLIKSNIFEGKYDPNMIETTDVFRKNVIDLFG